MSKRDRFSKMAISRQRRYQLRHAAQGLCCRCPEKAVLGNHCLRHAVLTRERARKINHCKKRLNSQSYRLELEAKNGHLPG